MKKLISLLMLLMLIALPALAEYEIDGARSVAFESGETARLAGELAVIRMAEALSCTIDGEPLELLEQDGAFVAEIPLTVPATLTVGEEAVLLFPTEESLSEHGAWSYTDAVYIVQLVGENGEPIPGAMLNICDKDTCEMIYVDEEGRVELIRTPYPYTVRVLRVPEGYTVSPAQSYQFPESGGELIISVG